MSERDEAAMRGARQAWAARVGVIGTPDEHANAIGRAALAAADGVARMGERDELRGGIGMTDDEVFTEALSKAMSSWSAAEPGDRVLLALGFHAGWHNRDAEDRKLVRTYYRSITPNRKVWCESKDPQEVLRMSEGKDCTFETMRFYETTEGWEEWQGGADE